MLYWVFVLEFCKVIAAKIDLSHIAPDIVCSAVLICKGDSTVKLKCANN